VLGSDLSEVFFVGEALLGHLQAHETGQLEFACFEELGVGEEVYTFGRQGDEEAGDGSVNGFIFVKGLVSDVFGEGLPDAREGSEVS